MRFGVVESMRFGQLRISILFGANCAVRVADGAVFALRRQHSFAFDVWCGPWPRRSFECERNAATSSTQRRLSLLVFDGVRGFAPNGRSLWLAMVFGGVLTSNVRLPIDAQQHIRHKQLEM